MTSSAAYASASVLLGTGLLQIGDSARSGTPSAPVTICTGGGSGSRIDNLDWVATGPVTATTLRFWINTAGSYAPGPLPEQLIAASTPSTTQAASSGFSTSIFGNQLPIILPGPTSSLVATIANTQVVTAAKYDSIATAQTVSAGALFTLAGSAVTSASTTALASAVTTSGAGPLTLTSDPYVMTNPALVSIGSTANYSGVTFTIVGWLASGAFQIETLAGPNNSTVFSANAYAVVEDVYTSGALATGTNVGYSTAAVFSLPSKVQLSSFANLSASTATIIGTSSSGVLLTETLSGPNVGAVLSVNTYASVLQVKAVGAFATNITVGNPDILAGLQVFARGGNY